MSKDTGGPAFPVTAEQSPNGVFAQPGMDLRDYFAAKVMAVLLQGAVLPTKELRDEWFPKVAVASYEMADAMIAERSK